MYNYDRFVDNLKNINISVDNTQIEKFTLFYNILIEWNKKMNLTAITDFEEVVEKHFIDSISIHQFYPLNRSLSVLDMGTGAGFPGIPLKIIFPELQIVLVDSLKKRVSFLEEIIDRLQLKNIKAIHSRAEDLAGDAAYRENFDLTVSRAVANLSLLCEYCIPFVKRGGNFISYKSNQIEDELKEAEKAIRILGGSIKEVQKFHLSGTEAGRSFIIIDKIGKTPVHYPRRAGIPSKKPIK